MTRALLIVCLALFLSACGSAGSEDNFIFITLDTQRADFISAYEPENSSTPNIDSLAKKGILFENCYSLIPITLPSHASMFYSQPPHLIDNYNNGQVIREKRKRPSFITFFKRRNFTTAAFVSLGVMAEKFGLGEGFDLYNADFPVDRWYIPAEEVNARIFPWLEENKNSQFFLWAHFSDPHDPYAPPYLPNDFKVYLNDELIYDTSLRKYEFHTLDLQLKAGNNRIRLDIENRFVPNIDHYRAKMDTLEFTPDQKPGDIEIDLSRGWWIRRSNNVFHFKDRSLIDIVNHKGPRTVKFRFRGGLNLPEEGVRTLYREEVEYMDSEIGKLLEKLETLGIAGKTKILIIGDHGEGLGEFKQDNGDTHYGHIHFLNEPYMRVPLIIYDPKNIQPARREKIYTTPLDVAPTILKMMGIKGYQRSFMGRDLLQTIRDPEISIQQETHKPEAFQDKFAILRPPWHMIFTPESRTVELFNIVSDPEELENIYNKETLPPELKSLQLTLEEFARNVLKNKGEVKIDKKTEEMLRSLGYIK
ncbi:sulfatase [Acidobacteriota bacterium]